MHSTLLLLLWYCYVKVYNDLVAYMYISCLSPDHSYLDMTLDMAPPL